ncbi:MAG TPA: hypothetical protein DCM32_00275 [Xanthomonadaceae bacterium]|jgi:hypothetical protein|nr:hypothetical protein [Xanthomonadaceae bacterium]
MSTIVIKRSQAVWQDRTRAYTAWVDGKAVGRLEHGASLSVPVGAGEHEVQMRIDWCTSPALSVSVPVGGTVELECGPNANALLALLYITLWRHRYIWLKPATTE